jgi:AbiV family abortive infection protein
MKTPRNYYEAVFLEILADGYCKSINNARRLIDDGEILVKCGRFLPAINSFRLAVEELAKAHLINQAVVFDEDDKDKWKWFWKTFHNHKKKIRLLEHEFHWPSYQDRSEFHKRVNILLAQREESIYVQFDSDKKEFLSPEDFFRSKNAISRYAKNELQYAKHVYGMFIMAGEPKPDIMLKVFKHQHNSEKGENLKISEKKFSIRGYVKGQDSPAFYDDADSLEKARAKAKDAFEKGDFEKVVFWEEVKKGEKGIANTIQRDKKGKVEEVEGWWYGEEEVITKC